MTCCLRALTSNRQTLTTGMPLTLASGRADAHSWRGRADRAVFAVTAPNGGYRATAVTSDSHAARLVFQGISKPSADSVRLAGSSFRVVFACRSAISVWRFEELRGLFGSCGGPGVSRWRVNAGLVAELCPWLSVWLIGRFGFLGVGGLVAGLDEVLDGGPAVAVPPGDGEAGWLKSGDRDADDPFA
jgi:hypothetical protein